jgi:hypothetical protein
MLRCALVAFDNAATAGSDFRAQAQLGRWCAGEAGDAAQAQGGGQCAGVAAVAPAQKVMHRRCSARCDMTQQKTSCLLPMFCIISPCFTILKCNTIHHLHGAPAPCSKLLLLRTCRCRFCCRSAPRRSQQLHYPAPMSELLLLQNRNIQRRVTVHSAGDVHIGAGLQRAASEQRVHTCSTGCCVQGTLCTHAVCWGCTCSNMRTMCSWPWNTAQCSALSPSSASTACTSAPAWRARECCSCCMQ